MGRLGFFAWIGLSVTACGYDFGGGAGGAGASTTTGAVTTGASASGGDTAATTAATSVASTGETGSVVASTADGTTASAASSSTGGGPLVSCFADTFDGDLENPPWDTFGDVDQENGRLVLTGSGGDGLLTRFRVDDCFVSVSFDPGSSADLYLDVRQSQTEVISVNRFTGDRVTFEQDGVLLATVPMAAGVDAIALHFGSQQVTALFRQGNTWTRIVPAIDPRPLWLDGENGLGEVGGFGITSDGGETMTIQDFSIATPPAP